MELEDFDLGPRGRGGGMILLPPWNLVLVIDKVMMFNSASWTFVYPEENKQAYFQMLLSVGQTQPDFLVATTFSQLCFHQCFQALLVIVTVIVPTDYLQFSKLHMESLERTLVQGCL